MLTKEQNPIGRIVFVRPLWNRYGLIRLLCDESMRAEM